MEETLDNPKTRILEFITANPSSHLRKIKNNLGYSMGTIQYYLKILENEKKIKSSKTKFYRNYYAIDEHDEKILCMLNLDSPRKIILHLIQNESSTHAEIAHAVNLSPATINWHMKKLLELEIVQSEFSEKFTIYHLKDKNKIMDSLKKCKSSVWYTMINNVTDIFSSINQD